MKSYACICDAATANDIACVFGSFLPVTEEVSPVDADRLPSRVP